MDLLKATLNMLNHCKTMLKMSEKMMWMKEVMKPLNMLKYVPVRPRGAVLLDKTGMLKLCTLD